MWESQKLDTNYGLGSEMEIETVVDHHTVTHPRGTEWGKYDHRLEEDTCLGGWDYNNGGSCEVYTPSLGQQFPCGTFLSLPWIFQAKAASLPSIQLPIIANPTVTLRKQPRPTSQ